MIDEIQLASYHAAHESAAFADISNWGWVRLTGRDRLELLQRLSTNDLKKLAPGQGAPTVFTSPTGRVMALLTVYAGEDDVFVRTMPGQGAGVTRYLNGMIFWQDQVEVADLTADTCQFALFGPQAAEALQTITANRVTSLQPYSWRRASLAAAAASVHRGGPLEAFQWILKVAASDRQAVLDALASLAAPLNAETADLLRVEAGLPMWGFELNEQVTPLETGLLGAISFNKGCYTGQEVIARQTNYDKVTRNLVGLELPLPADSPLVLRGRGESGDVLVKGPGRGGFVGSIAYSPALGTIIALAVVPRELAEPGHTVVVVAGDLTVQATVRSLPFIPKPEG